MDARQAFKELRDGQVRPLYVCCGTETYRMNDFTERLVGRLTEPEHRDMAVVRFDTAEHPLDAILEEAQTLPFLVPNKLILVRDNVVFGSGRESAKVEHRTDKLLEYFRQPMESTVLVFLVASEKLDERKKLTKRAKEDGFVVTFAPLQPDELVQWVCGRASKQGRTLEPQAAEELLRRVGTEMGALAAETDKLCLHAGEKGTVTAAAVAELVTASTEQSVFKLTEEIASLRTDRAVALYYDLLKQREEPIKLASLLVRQFRNMLFVKELGKTGYSPQQMAGQLGLHPYAVKITADQARGFSTERLTALLDRLAELDYAMKSGRVDKTLGLELFLLRTGSEGGA
ncbi:DNA polymerase III subunit delta [Cohnella nanjingensis]|uniref:DNA polymerase III subunit delta n=1 Tax=Cohnella nanjingensis TaxID=1387779 RepID=A0A7X0RWV6_9BACL|nr:DNA polymerase III subunit delta [Cohnella nanjingensis]MBB6673951.1 DNA polymerase III subunit delta [Cohnella nanjingensis]